MDPSLFPEATAYEGHFQIPRFAAPAEQPPIAPPAATPSLVLPARHPSNIASRHGLRLVGRDDLLQDILAALGDASTERVLVLHGPPGVGKSELAREFARRQRERYPGGMYFVDASSGDVLVDLVRVGVNHLNLDFSPGLSLKDQCEQTLLSLGAAPTLLIYDNTPSAESIRRWLPPAGMPCQVLITTVLDRWDPGFLGLPVSPLSTEASLELIQELGGRQVRERYGQALAELAEGLPVQLCPAATTLASEARRGRLDSVRLELTREAHESFNLVYERLESRFQLLLQAAAFLNCQRIVAREFYHHLSIATGWSEVEFQRLLDACRDLHLLEGDRILRMHQLFAAFLHDAQVSDENVAVLGQVRCAQQSRLLEVARALSVNPEISDLATALTGFPLAPKAWDEAKVGISISDGEDIGLALYEIGKFEEAQPWYERAVEEAQQGDVHGRIDHDSLGSSHHQVGLCLSSEGKYEEARPWYERAVEEKQQGDVHGHVDHESLGSSQHQVGLCLSIEGKNEEARQWYERAVEETQQGDVHGRVDHESLGRSLHRVGFCLSSEGKNEEARQWYERAIEEAQQGDVHRRVDHESLGRSLRAGADCLRRLGLVKEAKDWETRASRLPSMSSPTRT